MKMGLPNFSYMPETGIIIKSLVIHDGRRCHALYEYLVRLVYVPYNEARLRYLEVILKIAKSMWESNLVCVEVQRDWRKIPLLPIQIPTSAKELLRSLYSISTYLNAMDFDSVPAPISLEYLICRLRAMDLGGDIL